MQRSCCGLTSTFGLPGKIHSSWKMFLFMCNPELHMNGMLNNPELAIDEGTISLSSQYSEGLLSTLNLALQNSGLDLSQASISVQINVGKWAIRRRNDPGPNPTSKDLMNQASHDQEIGQHLIRSGDDAREHSRATKRHRSAYFSTFFTSRSGMLPMSNSSANLAELTIFYGGSVCVYDSVPPEKFVFV